MTTPPPSRLPSAFIRVSRCPICNYSLKDLAQDAPCPECGQDIDRDLYTSPEIQDAVAATKTWCTMGIIAWIICAVGYWLLSMAMLNMSNFYFPGSIGTNDYIGVWLRTSIVIAPIALACRWWRRARRIIYTLAQKMNPERVRVPRRVIVVNLLGIVLLLGSCFLGIVASIA